MSYVEFESVERTTKKIVALFHEFIVLASVLGHFFHVIKSHGFSNNTFDKFHLVLKINETRGHE